MRRPTRVRGLLWATLSSPGLTPGRAPVSRRPRPHGLPRSGRSSWGSTITRTRRSPAADTAVRNAQRVQQWIRRTGWDDRHQLLLSDFGSADPGELAAPSAEHPADPAEPGLGVPAMAAARTHAPGDMVVFYFAGESRTVARRRGPGSTCGTISCPGTPIRRGLEQTGWSLERRRQPVRPAEAPGRLLAGHRARRARRPRRAAARGAAARRGGRREVPAAGVRRASPGCRGWHAGPG